MNQLLNLLTPVNLKTRNKGGNSANDAFSFSLYFVKGKSYYIHFNKSSILLDKCKTITIAEMGNESFLVAHEDMTGPLKVTNLLKGGRINSVELAYYLIGKFNLKYTNNNALKVDFSLVVISDNIYKIIPK